MNHTLCYEIVQIVLNEALVWVIEGPSAGGTIGHLCGGTASVFMPPQMNHAPPSRLKHTHLNTFPVRWRNPDGGRGARKGEDGGGGGGGGGKVCTQIG